MSGNYYKILGLNKKATLGDIKIAYKKLALKYHPDRNQNNIVAEELFKKINEAYQLLSDPEKKILYDQKLDYGFSFESTSGNPPASNYYRHHHGRVEPLPNPVIKKMYIYLSFGLIILYALVYFGLKEIMQHAALESLEKAQLYYFDEGSVSKALLKLEEAFSNDSELVGANYLYGLILSEKLQNYQRALFYLNRAIKFSEKPHIPSLWERAKCNHKLEDKIMVAIDLQKILAVQANHLEANLLMGDLSLYEHLNYNESEKYYSNVLKNDSLNLEIKMEALIGKTIALYKQKDFRNSTKYIEKALKLQPNNGVVYYYLAFTKLESEHDTIAACNSFYKASSLGIKQADILIKRICENK